MLGFMMFIVWFWNYAPPAVDFEIWDRHFAASCRWAQTTTVVRLHFCFREVACHVSFGSLWRIPQAAANKKNTLSGPIQSLLRHPRHDIHSHLAAWSLRTMKESNDDLAGWEVMEGFKYFGGLFVFGQVFSGHVIFFEWKKLLVWWFLCDMSSYGSQGSKR